MEGTNKLKVTRFLLVTAATILLLLFLFTQLPFANGAGKWYYWIESGAYAKYTYIRKQALHEQFYLTNGSMRGYTNFTLAWAVTDVQKLYATVDYNLTFYGVKIYFNDFVFGPYVELGNMSFTTTLTVQLDTLELVENGATWGRWPYWIHGWEVGKNVTMIYNYPVSPYWMGQVGGEPKNVTVSLHASLDSFQYARFERPVYNFTQERLITASTHITLEIIDNKTYGNFVTRFDALYDSVSLICVGFAPQSGEMADGIMYHRLGVWDITYAGNVILVDSNVNFDPFETPEEETPTLPASLIAGITIVIALPIFGVILKIKTKHRGQTP
jgi:hypothetical protein